MEMTEKKNDLKSMMVESMEKVKEMVDANNIVGEPIVGAITEQKQAETLQKLIDQALAADMG